jgi:hypothetical protein
MKTVNKKVPSNKAILPVKNAKLEKVFNALAKCAPEAIGIRTRENGLIINAGKEFATFAKSKGIGGVELVQFKAAGKMTGNKKIIESVRVLLQDTLTAQGVDRAIANTYFSRVKWSAGEQLDPEGVKNLKGKGTPKNSQTKKRAGKDSKKSGQTISVSDMTSAQLKSMITAISARVRDMGDPDFNVNDVMKGLTLAIKGFDKHIILKKAA